MVETRCEDLISQLLNSNNNMKHSNEHKVIEEMSDNLIR